MRVTTGIFIMTLAVFLGMAPTLRGADTKPADTKKPAAANPADAKPSQNRLP